MLAELLNYHNYVFNPFALPVWFVGAMILALGIHVVNNEHASVSSVVFLTLTLCVAAWLVGYSFAYSSAYRFVALWWVKGLHIGVTFIPSLIFIFTLSIVRQLRHNKMTALFSLLVSSGFSLALIFTSALVSDVQHYPWGYYGRFGWLGAPFLAFFFFMLVISMSVLFWYHHFAQGNHRRRLKAFIMAFGIGYLGAVDFIANYGVVFYPFGYLPVLGFFVLATRVIKQYHLVDITPAFASEKIIAIMSDALIVLDEEGMIKLVNRAACNLFGYEEDQLLQKPAKAALGGLLFSGPLARLPETGSVQDYEFEYISKSQGPRRISVSASTMKAEDKKPLAHVFVIRDTTEGHKAQEALLKKTEELARSNAELDQLELFAFVASHDLQEPLRKIVSFGDRLKAQGTSGMDETSKNYVERMVAAAGRMSQYIRDLVEFTRVTTKTQPFETVELEQVLREVMTDLELRISELSAKIEISQLPPVMADRLQMRQLFQNLIANALKFAKKDERPHIRISSRPVNGSVEIAVKDNGIGFEQKYAGKIFKPFERLHDRSQYEGSGMGLAICQRIVLRHRGQIGVESVPGKGSSFFITLPVAPEPGSQHTT